MIPLEEQCTPCSWLGIESLGEYSSYHFESVCEFHRTHPYDQRPPHSVAAPSVIRSADPADEPIFLAKTPLRTRIWQELRVESPLHNNMRLVDLCAILLIMIGCIIVQHMLWDSEWMVLVMFVAVYAGMYLARKWIRSYDSNRR